jgi:hypothetical protein
VAASPAHAGEGTFSLTAASMPAAVDSGDTIEVSLSFQCVGAPGDVCSNARIDLPWNFPVELVWTISPPVQPDLTLAATIRGLVGPGAPVGHLVSASTSAVAYAAEEPRLQSWDSASADLQVTDPIPVPGVEARSPELRGGPHPARLAVRWPPPAPRSCLRSEARG